MKSRKLDRYEELVHYGLMDEVTGLAGVIEFDKIKRWRASLIGKNVNGDYYVICTRKIRGCAA